MQKRNSHASISRILLLIRMPLQIHQATLPTPAPPFWTMSNCTMFSCRIVFCPAHTMRRLKNCVEVSRSLHAFLSLRYVSGWVPL